MDIDQSQNHDSRIRTIFWILLGSAAVLGVANIFLRIIDGDEGFYLSAAQMLSTGARPYLDFFFPQMPGVPIFLAPFAGHGWTSLFLSRGFGLLCHLLLAFLLFRLALSVSSDKRVSLGVFFFAVLSGPLMTWNSLAKPYALSNLFLMASFLMIVMVLRQRSPNYLSIFLAFLFLGMTINVRIIFVIFIPLYFFLLYFSLRTLKILRFPYFMGALLLGLLIPSAYSLMLFIHSPEQFLFDNLGFHLLRAQDYSFGYVILMKLAVLGKILIQPQYLIPLALAIGSIFVINSQKFRREYNSWERMVVHLALVMAAFIAVIYMIPHPVHVQYFNQTLPFLIIASIPSIKFILEKEGLLKTAVPALYLLGILIYPGLYILDVRNKYDNYKIDNVRKVTASIKENSTPDDLVLSEWVAYDVLAQRKQPSGGEFVGHKYLFSRPIISYGRYHMLSDERINFLLRDSVPKLVVIMHQPIDSWLKELEKNYQTLVKVNDVFIYDRKTGGQIN